MSTANLPEKLVNLSKLEAATGGNSDFMQKMVHLFLEDTPPQIESMQEALDNGDYETVSSIAHKLKPSIEMVACPELGVLIRKVETGEGENTEAETDILIESILRLIEQLRIH